MKYYLAPMEGITGYIYRNTYNKFFDNVDKYFAPFILANKSESLKTKELRDLLPENNKGIKLVPQILTNDCEAFAATCRKLQQLGYSEVNLNLGCPSGTVVSKNKGAGFLGNREELDRFLEKIFKAESIKVSIKTRLGLENSEEFYELIKIYNKYPLSELIIHPRTRKDFYGNKPNLEIFKDALALSKNTVCYNGDIFTVEDYKALTDNFSELESVMLGRGILANPGLMKDIKEKTKLDKKLLKAFHDELFNNYKEVYKEERNALFKMKELWGYMIYLFSDNKKYVKKIKKSQKENEYKAVVLNLFEEQEVIEGAGLFYKQ
ncbi:tRNA-dihydrouridine synthase family protein [Clostridium sp. 19966]|uniref:tRNA dihydrouridine synthase n=1 Tax=Clostridium sp. 19966 TaxID=2768166 RepID=UPI0028DE9548|nr:tRNA-dihydrouridine synthase family protein [Clostridium sp. 19966]MDT8717327.1 tRNA-dihydrouridine synthase family protein [Clostridium sp. 19966]